MDKLESGDDSEPRLKRIGTHDGTFHADEVLACVMLKRTEKFSNATIVRTRDGDILKDCDIVVDVGGIYNHTSARYDHHQRDFATTMSELHPKLTGSSIKLSSAGLIYAHFGHILIRKYIKEGDFETIKVVTPDLVDAVWVKLYDTFIKEIDAIDNGVNITEQPRYKINTNLSARVGKLNPQWRGPARDAATQFDLAMQLVEVEFLSELNDLIQYWWPARDIVFKSIEDRDKKSPSMQQIVTLPSFCPWMTHLFEYETVHKQDGSIKYVLFQDKEQWRVRAVPSSLDSFNLRYGLHPDWRGLRDLELCKKSNIAGCVFVHVSGFIGGNLTYEGAVEMALKSIDYYEFK